jgi:RNA polymerase sigma-70 factor (ECF subfamily)
MQWDPAEFDRCYEAYAGTLFRLAMAQLGDRSDAEDVVQEAFLRRFQRRDFRDAEHEKRWLMRVTVNLCHDLQKSRQRHPTVPLLESDAAPAEPAQEALDLLAQLPEPVRAVFHLYYYEGYLVREIAQMLRLTPSAVKMRLRRGRALLKTQWEDGT